MRAALWAKETWMISWHCRPREVGPQSFLNHITMYFPAGNRTGMHKMRREWTEVVLLYLNEPPWYFTASQHMKHSWCTQHVDCQVNQLHLGLVHCIYQDHICGVRVQWNNMWRVLFKQRQLAYVSFVALWIGFHRVSRMKHYTSDI